MPARLLLTTLLLAATASAQTEPDDHLYRAFYLEKALGDWYEQFSGSKFLEQTGAPLISKPFDLETLDREVVRVAGRAEEAPHATNATN